MRSWWNLGLTCFLERRAHRPGEGTLARVNECFAQSVRVQVGGLQKEEMLAGRAVTVGACAESCLSMHVVVLLALFVARSTSSSTCRRAASRAAPFINSTLQYVSCVYRAFCLFLSDQCRLFPSPTAFPRPKHVDRRQSSIASCTSRHSPPAEPLFGRQICCLHARQVCFRVRSTRPPINGAAARQAWRPACAPNATPAPLDHLTRSLVAVAAPCLVATSGALRQRLRYASFEKHKPVGPAMPEMRRPATKLFHS